MQVMKETKTTVDFLKKTQDTMLWKMEQIMHRYRSQNKENTPVSTPFPRKFICHGN